MVVVHEAPEFRLKESTSPVSAGFCNRFSNSTSGSDSSQTGRTLGASEATSCRHATSSTDVSAGSRDARRVPVLGSAWASPGGAGHPCAESIHRDIGTTETWT